MRPVIPFALLLAAAASASGRAADSGAIAPSSDASIPAHLARDAQPFYTAFHQRDFPFAEATVDFRDLAPAGNTDHLVPRALLLSPAEDVFVCFDTELLRVAGVWTGAPLTPYSMAMLSYGSPRRKIAWGQENLARPAGRIVSATGLYPGWHFTADPVWTDPRSRGVDPAELGRGPLPAAHARWHGVADLGATAALHYSVGTATVIERHTVVEHEDRRFLLRQLELSALDAPVHLVVAELDHAADRVPPAWAARGGELTLREGRRLVVSLAAAPAPRTLVIALALDSSAQPVPSAILETDTPATSSSVNRAAAVAVTQFAAGRAQGAYAVDELVLPYPNPWQRRIRPTDIDFLPNGDAVVVTFDGDVYRLEGLAGAADAPVRVRRIASGFNEPQALRVRDHEVFVFSRLGVTRLQDLDGDGDTDFYAMFSNGFVQSAETRAYPLSLALRDDGGFLLSTGGQQESSASPGAGRVLHLAPDGALLGVYADGLRNGYLARHAHHPNVTASDQQGNWVPATPLHAIRAGGFYGFEPGTSAVREVAPVPLWIPHRVAQSGIDQVWAGDDRAGPLTGTLLYVDYYKPRLLKILGADRDPLIQAAAMVLPVEFETPLLKGEISPADGLPYFVGMQIWGSQAARLEGLCRLRPLAADDGLPVEAEIFAEGVWLRFAAPLPEDAHEPAHYRVGAWSYRRTAEYGSAQYRTDGTPGVDPWPVHQVLVSSDRRAVFLAIANTRLIDQLEVRQRVRNGEWQVTHFTVNALPPLPADRAPALGHPDFPELFSGPPAPRAADATETLISAARGADVATTFGCIGCHSVDGSTEGRSGPTWQGLYRRARSLQDGRTATANEEYLRRAIWDPTAQVVAGYDPREAGMPSYRGVLSEDEVESLVLYIQSLSVPAGSP